METPIDPAVLDYSSGARPVGTFHYARAAMLVLFTALLPLAAAAWAYFGCKWLVAQPWFRSGQPIEGIYEPRLIELPVLAATMGLAIEGVIVLVMVVRRRWQTYWLAAIPVIGMTWFGLVAYMLQLSENYFP